ncbi:Rrf2 family transcriptional regulator [Paenibacillus woosongensis]|uniref:Transcriptional regulator n=1 Tax=Paenibacillus woosongensis TaxID=307580 RepID=A0A7X3CR41_9BACL|nr:Rrf2 family transcriptional regulator [Paenibacillus woosongensis]MUG47775.1 transcriptional regulator [Paenibacillus woosongensis]
MTISSRFAVAIHILTVLETNRGGVNTSEYISDSVNTNPVVIRRITGMLSKAGLVEARPGVAGSKLAKEATDITLLDIYQAVHAVDENGLFAVHDKTNDNCPVGRNIQSTIEPVFAEAQKAMESTLQKVTLQDIVRDLESKP